MQRSDDLEWSRIHAILAGVSIAILGQLASVADPAPGYHPPFIYGAAKFLSVGIILNLMGYVVETRAEVIARVFKWRWAQLSFALLHDSAIVITVSGIGFLVCHFDYFIGSVFFEVGWAAVIGLGIWRVVAEFRFGRQIKSLQARFASLDLKKPEALEDAAAIAEQIIKSLELSLMCFYPRIVAIDREVKLAEARGMLVSMRFQQCLDASGRTVSLENAIGEPKA